MTPDYRQITVGKFIFRVASDNRYTEDGVWVSDGMGDGLLRLGLSDFRQQSSGDVAFVELPAVGQIVKAGETIADVETIKVDLEVTLPFDATVVAINEALSETPELINQDPYGTGWLVEVRPATLPVPGLLDADSYLAVMATQAEEAAR
jgi:glycine cleavage system H protein